MKTIETWFQEARWAPSGGNLQPWLVKATFTESHITVNLSIRPELLAAPSAADQWGAGALMGLGCYLENLIQLAPSFGFAFEEVKGMPAENLPDKQNYYHSTFVAIFSLKSSRIDSENISEATQKRTTHRWPMKTIPLQPEQLQKINSLCQVMNVKMVALSKECTTVTAVYRELAFVRMHNRNLFSELMHEIYDPKKSPGRQIGLPFSTLALPAATVLVLKLLQRLGLHPRSRWANQQSVTDSINTPLKHCSEIIYLKADDDTAQEWMRVGQLYQRLSLWAHENSLATQPIAYNLIAYNHLRNPKSTILDQGEQNEIEKCHHQVKDLLGIDFTIPGLMFRIGTPIQVASPSPRRPVDINLQKEEPSMKRL